MRTCRWPHPFGELLLVRQFGLRFGFRASGPALGPRPERLRTSGPVLAAPAFQGCDARDRVLRHDLRLGQTVLDVVARRGDLRLPVVASAAAAKGQPYLLEIDPKTDTTEIVYRSAAMTTGLKKGYTAGIRGLTVVNNQLIASMITDNGATIVASSNPSAGQDSFATIATQTEGLYNYPACAVTDGVFGGCVWDMVGFKGNLYVTMVTGTAKNNKQSFALVRGTQDKETGKWTFKPLVGDPADGAKYEWGFGASRSGAANMVVYKGHLYIGGYNDPMNALEKAMQMDFSDLYKDLESPVNLWRMDVDEDGNENFEMLAGEANNKYFGDSKGTIDGNTMLSGLGDSDEQSRHLNQYVWRMQSYNGKLYVGTFDISDLAYPATQFANGDILKRTPEEWKKQIEYIKIFFDSLKKNDQNGTSGTTDTDSQEATEPSESDSQEATKPGDNNDIMPLSEGDETSENNQAAQAVEEAGKIDEVAADVATMQQQLEDMGADLSSKQTDVAPLTALPHSLPKPTHSMIVISSSHPCSACSTCITRTSSICRIPSPMSSTSGLPKRIWKTSPTSWACSVICITPTMRLVAST